MASATSSTGPASLGSQVHAAAVNGDRSALVKLIAEPPLRDHEDQFGRTPLMYCVLADRLDCAEVLLKAGASVNKTDHSQRSALHLAAQKGNVRFLKLLLSRRANWLQKDLEGMTPLHLATRHPSPKALALLLKHIGPGEVDTQDKNKQTALHWSAFYNRPEHVRLLIKHDSNIGIPDSEGKIPLHWAAHSQEASATQTVRCILEAAPTESLLNWQDFEGRTPLHFAVADGNQAVVEVLTSYEGCNVTAYDNLFRTPLHWAALLGHAKIVHLLLERNTSGMIPSDSQGATPLHYGAQSNNAETVGVFLSHPSVKDEPDLEGRTAFMWAAGKGSDDVIRTMLQLNLHIDINMPDKYGGTADEVVNRIMANLLIRPKTATIKLRQVSLHAAALSGHMSTVSLLLERGAMVDSLDVMKHTPLFRACEMGHRDVILTLIKGSGRVDLVDVDGHTALHWAALGGNAEVCQMLMENGISPNVQDHAGRTPLQCAAYGGYITCMAVLMENNADPNIQDKEGRTALHWSCNNGYLDAVKLLLSYSAFPNQMEHTEERYTPLDYALLGGHSEVTQFMLENGALSIAAIQDIAAATIQAVYKGFMVRKAFRERKQLLMRHEQLRKDAAKKREEEQRRREAREVLVSAEDKRTPMKKVVQKQSSLETALQGLTMYESQREIRKLSRMDFSKSKEETPKAQKSRCPRRIRVSERQKSPDALGSVAAVGSDTDDYQIPRMNVQTFLTRNRETSALKPRPPAEPKAKERPSSNTLVQPTPVSTLNQSKTRDVHMSIQTAYGRSDACARAATRKHRKHKEQTPGKTTKNKDYASADSLRKSSTSDRRKLSIRAKSEPCDTRSQTEYGRDEVTRRMAAQVIQRAWRRFCARKGKERICEELKSGESNTKRKMESRASHGKMAQNKNSVLENIYGRRGQLLKSSSLQLPLDVAVRTQSQLSGLSCVHLTETLNQARHYSYHLRPQSTGRGTRGRQKH